MSDFIINSPRSPQAAFPPLFGKRGAKHRRCDGVSQNIVQVVMRHFFIRISLYLDYKWVFLNCLLFVKG